MGGGGYDSIFLRSRREARPTGPTRREGVTNLDVQTYVLCLAGAFVSRLAAMSHVLPFGIVALKDGYDVARYNNVI